MSATTSPTLALACELVARASVTPQDAGCQDIIAARLQALGFSVERLRFGEVDNLWARRGQGHPLFVFAGHTDVVPPGPLQQWHSDPFTPELRDGMLYGRGAADMKGSLAAMVTACERLLARAEPRGSIGFLITSDEEGPAVDGTVRVVEWLQAHNERIECCLVGEPTSDKRLADVVRNGRRGSLSGRLRVLGVQGHVAYPELADNPIHRALPALSALCTEQWDEGNEFFPPTSFQISNIHAGTGADNVIPGELEVLFNFRYSTETSEQALRERVAAILRAFELNHSIEWRHSGAPFLTPAGELVDELIATIEELTGSPPLLSTGGGTSDGRFIAPTGAQVVELGPRNASIHKVDEHVSVQELDQLSQLYERLMEKLLCS